jgi:hypothetical protein
VTHGPACGTRGRASRRVPPYPTLGNFSGGIEEAMNLFAVCVVHGKQLTDWM